MADPRFALLNASLNGENTSRNFRREFDVGLEEFDATAGELPDGFAYDAAVVTGSGASTYWDEEWIGELRGWLSEADDRGVALLGVCFGHQILAEALGGSVGDMGEYELGYHEIEHAGSPIFEGIDRRFTAFTTHHDEVTELPPGAERTAANDYSIQGFRRGDAFGLQFHPEFDAATARRATESKDLPDERIRSVLSGITAENEERARGAKRVFGNFTRYVRGRVDAASADD